MTGLTTHVLDTASGRPAQGLVIELYRLGGDPLQGDLAGVHLPEGDVAGSDVPVRGLPESDRREKLKTVVTNADGRVDGGPLLTGEAFVAGTYELVFHAGDYLRSQGVALPQPAFLDIVPIRFGLADPTAHYHVPLLISPYGYSTYRGS